MRGAGPGVPGTATERRAVAGIGPLALGVTVALGVMALLCAWSALTFGHRGDVVGGVTPTELVAGDALDRVEDADDRVQVTRAASLVGALVTGPLFIAWQYRHAVRARQLGARGRLGPSWAIFGWFLPCAQLVVPGLQLFGASKASDPGVDLDHADRGRGRIVVVPWAIALGVGAFLGRYSRRSDERRLGAIDRQWLDDAARSDLVNAIGLWALVVAALLAMVMVLDLTRRQAAKLATAGVDDRG